MRLNAGDVDVLDDKLKPVVHARLPGSDQVIDDALLDLLVKTDGTMEGSCFNARNRAGTIQAIKRTTYSRADDENAAMGEEQ